MYLDLHIYIESAQCDQIWKKIKTLRQFFDGLVSVGQILNPLWQIFYTNW